MDGAIGQRDAPSFKTVFDTLFDIHTYFSNAYGAFNVVMGAEFDKGAKAEKYYTELQSEMYNRLSFAFQKLEHDYAKLAQQGGDMVKDVYLPHAKVMIDEARKNLIMSETDKKLEAELRTASFETFTKQRGEFKWKGEKMTRPAYYKALEVTTDPKEREDLTSAYAAVTINVFKGEKGLFGAIDKLNVIAAKYGYSDYADMAVRVYNLAEIKDFEAMMDEWSNQYGGELKGFVDRLREINGGKEVNEWDVPYLANLAIKNETGLENVPTISPVDAMKVAKEFYADIGVDLDKPPFAGNIFFDIKARDNKYPNAFAESAGGDGSKAWFNTNDDPKKQLGLYDLETIVHELGHDIQFIACSKNAGGNVAAGIYAQSIAFAEGFAITIKQSFQLSTTSYFIRSASFT